MPFGMFPNQMKNNMMPNLPGASTTQLPKWPMGLMASSSPAMNGKATGTPTAPPPNPVPFNANDTRDQINGNIMGLLQGKNAAADQADRSAMTGISSMQKSADAGLQRQAATMGLQQGDPRMAKFMQQQNAQTQSMGSKLLSDNTQRRLDDQNKALSTANTFLTGQQANELDQSKLKENSRQFDTVQGAADKAASIKTLQDIISNPLSSEGQVEAAKQALFEQQGGLDPSLLSQKDKTNAQNQFNEIRSYLEVMNPGMSPADLDNLARERMQTLDKSTFGALENSVATDQPKVPKTINGVPVHDGSLLGSKLPKSGSKSPGFDPVFDTGHAIAGGARKVGRFLGGLF